jgi:hypothetical protein
MRNARGAPLFVLRGRDPRTVLMESRFPILAHHSVRGVAVSLWPDIGAVVTDGSGRRGAAAHPLCKQEYAMHRRALPFVMIAVALSAVFVAHASVPDDAEVALDGLSFSSQNANRSWSLETAGRPICSERFEVRSGDVWPHDLQTGNAGTERSELAGPIDATNPGAFDTNVWTAYQFRVQRGARVTSPWVVLGDWHMLPDPGDIGAGSSWQLELDAGDILGFETRTSTEKPIVDGPHMHYIWKSAAPVSRGVWHSLVSRGRQRRHRCVARRHADHPLPRARRLQHHAAALFQIRRLSRGGAGDAGGILFQRRRQPHIASVARNAGAEDLRE